MLLFQLVFCALLLWRKAESFGRKLKDIHHPLLFIHNKHLESRRNLTENGIAPTPHIVQHKQHSKLSKTRRKYSDRLDITEITKIPGFMASCKRICKCFPVSPKEHLESGLSPGRSITDYLIDCSTIKDFQEVGKLEIPKGKTIKAVIRDATTKIINGSCITDTVSEKSEVCFPSEIEFPLFKRIKVLQLQDFPQLTDLGNQQSDFFSILPNVKFLTINTKASHVVNVYFSNSAQNLKDVKINLSQNETMQMRCRSKLCFPTSLNSLTVKYSSASSLRLKSSMALPKVIKNVTITIDSQEMEFTKPSDILVGAKIKNLQLKVVGKGDFVISLKNMKVLKSFQLTLGPTQIINDIPYYYHYKQMYEVFDNPSLKKMVDLTLLGASKEQNMLPVMISNARAHFKKSFFDTCHLAKRVLSNANETVFEVNGQRKIFVRGFVYDLFETIDLLSTFDEVVVTTYHAYISRTFKVPQNKTLKVRYFKIGSNLLTSENKGSVQSIDVDPTETSKFTFQDSDVRADLIKYSSSSDPIFVRALSLCVIQNIGAFAKRKSGSRSGFELDRKDFWLVGTSFPGNLTFDEEFDIKEKALAWESLSNMNRYLQTVVQERNNIKTMSKVTLRNINNGRYFFQTYGNQIFESDSKDSMNESSLKEVRDRIDKFQWKTLDHVYHAITVYKDRLAHVLDSHTNGRPLLYQLVSMFNKYKKQVDENKEKLNRVTKQTNSFTRAKAITVIINSLSLLFEDKRTFEHTVKTLDNDWKPEPIDKIIESMKSIRKLVLALDSISVTFSKMKSKMESKELKFLKYAENFSKLVKKLIINRNGTDKKEHRNIKARLRTLDSLKADLSYPDQVVKLVICIDDIIQMGRQLDNTHRHVFDKIPEPISFFNPSDANLLYYKALNVSIDVSMKWSEIKSWLASTLNSTTVKQMFQKLDVRYPIVDLVETAEDITQEMVSNFGYQMVGIEMYVMYLVGYQKALAFYKLTKQGNGYDDKTKLVQLLETNTESEIVSLKVELVSDVFLWCDSYFYKTHQSCPVEFRGVNVIDPLKDLLNVHEYLLQHDPDGYQGSIKPIETLFNHELTYEVPNHCQCFKPNSNKEESSAEQGNHDDDGYMSKFSCAQLRIKENENRTTSSLDELEDIANQCLNNKIKELHTFNAFSLKLDPDSFATDNKDMMTVQTIDVILHGAHTTKRELKMYLTTTGVYQLRINKEVFTTFEDTLLQELAYEIYNIPQQQQQQQQQQQPYYTTIVGDDGHESKSLMNPRQASIRSDISLADVNKVKSDINSFEETVNELKNSILKSEESLSNIDDDSRKNIDSNDNDESTDYLQNSGKILIPKYRMELNKPLFTTWVVIVPKDMNPGLNIKNVKKITVRIAGTFRSYVRKNVMVL